MTACCGFQMYTPPRHLRQLPGNTFDLNPKWERTLPSFGNFSLNMYRVPRQTQIWKFIFDTCCGLEVQNPTRALKSVKDQGNTFHLNYKWERTLPSLRNCSSNIYMNRRLIQISKLIFDTLLWTWSANSHPGTYVSKRPGPYFWHKSQVGKNFAVLWQFYMGYL